MSVRNLDKLFKPRSVALIGATDRGRARSARSWLRNLRRAGFAGQLMLVNPHHQALDGLPVYPDCRKPAAAARPRGHRHAARDRAGAGRRARRARHARRGRHYRRFRRAGRARPRPAAGRARCGAARTCCGSSGPIASASWCRGSGSTPASRTSRRQPGDIAFVSQSGAMITAMLDWAAPRGIGFSHVVSLGDMADVDFGDMLDYLAADPQHARHPALCRGHHPRPQIHVGGARRRARSSRCSVLKAGRSAAGARAAASHTGVLAGATRSTTPPSAAPACCASRRWPSCSTPRRRWR